VELDVRRTADGSLVIHHDIELDGLGPISACVRREMPEWMPTLEEALTVCAEVGLDVNVEVKSELTGTSHDPLERCAREAAAVCAAAFTDRRLVLSSFAPAALAAVREVSTELAIAWLVGKPAPEPGPPWREGILRTLDLEGVHPFDWLVDAAYLTRAREDGLAVRVWTVDEPKRLAELGRLGVDAVITNDVGVARVALGGL
jgi:glycerophosphoryl diester phosphodiesterase